jgi:hypothetical protein
MKRRALLLLAVVIGACFSADAAEAAAPRYIMVTGNGIAKTILLANWRENFALEMAVANAPKTDAPANLAVRPRLKLSLFWGWDEHRPKWPGEANQRGWLYPAVGSQPALVALKVDGSSKLRVATPPLLRILRNHSVPTRAR